MNADAIAKPSFLPPFAPARARAVPLLMSDYWVLAAFWLALFFVADPFGWRLEKQLLTKHLPLFLALAGLLVANVGRVLFPADRSAAPAARWRVLSAGLPLFLLGSWVLIGSWYTRNYNGIHNTFLGMGLYMLFALLVARLVLISAARERIVRGFLYGAIAVSAFMVLRMVTEVGARDVSYHELEALTIPLAVYFAMRPTRSPGWQTLLLAFFLLGGLVYRKNTGYLVMMVTALYLWLVHWRFRFRESPGFRRAAVAWLTVLLLTGIAAVSYRAYIAGEWLPSGNPQYRMKTYETAWNNFRDSPVWGNGFTGSGTEKFKGFEINVARGVLPSHSDVLDIAANGGALAVLLWLWAYLRAGRLAWRNVLRHRPPDDLTAAAHALACMSLTAIIVYAFNPIMLQPVKALLLWGQFGLLLGIALYRGANPLAGGAPPAGRPPSPFAMPPRPRAPVAPAAVAVGVSAAGPVDTGSAAEPAGDSTAATEPQAAEMPAPPPATPEIPPRPPEVPPELPPEVAPELPPAAPPGTPPELPPDTPPEVPTEVPPEIPPEIPPDNPQAGTP